MLRIRVNAQGPKKALDEVRRRLANLEPGLRVPAEIIKREIDQAFLGSRAPDGVAWAPLAPATLARKRAQGFSIKPLIRRGARGLRGQIVSRATQRGIRVGIGPLTPYGVFHQYGTVRIPARPFLPVRGTPSAPVLMTAGPMARALTEIRKAIVKYLLTGR